MQKVIQLRVPLHVQAERPRWIIQIWYVGIRMGGTFANHSMDAKNHQLFLFQASPLIPMQEDRQAHVMLELRVIPSGNDVFRVQLLETVPESTEQRLHVVQFLDPHNVFQLVIFHQVSKPVCEGYIGEPRFVHQIRFADLHINGLPKLFEDGVCTSFAP